MKFLTILIVFMFSFHAFAGPNGGGGGGHLVTMAHTDMPVEIVDGEVLLTEEQAALLEALKESDRAVLLAGPGSGFGGGHGGPVEKMAFGNPVEVLDGEVLLTEEQAALLEALKESDRAVLLAGPGTGFIDVSFHAFAGPGGGYAVPVMMAYADLPVEVVLEEQSMYPQIPSVKFRGESEVKMYSTEDIEDMHWEKSVSTGWYDTEEDV